MTAPQTARRSALLWLAGCGLAGCGLEERPYIASHRWPLQVLRPIVLPPRIGGQLLELRSITAAPGLESDALQALQPDGSLTLDAYERWSVPPADGVGESLRLWLAQSGLFGGVVGQGSRARADMALERELTVLLSDLPAQLVRAAVTVTTVDLHNPARSILMQASLTATAPLAETSAAAQAKAQNLAIFDLFLKIEAHLSQKLIQ